MKLRVFTMRWDDGRRRFDDEEMRSFLEEEGTEREVIEASDHFFEHDEQPVWAVMLRYRESRDPGRARTGNELRKDWRADLDDREKTLYDELRTWWTRAARRDGLPPYLIFTNRQAAQIAAERPATIAGLRKVEGIGESKAARWGDEVLVVISAFENRAKEGAEERDDRSGAADHAPLGKDDT